MKQLKQTRKDDEVGVINAYFNSYNSPQHKDARSRLKS